MVLVLPILSAKQVMSTLLNPFSQRRGNHAQARNSRAKCPANEASKAHAKCCANERYHRVKHLHFRNNWISSFTCHCQGTLFSHQNPPNIVIGFTSHPRRHTHFAQSLHFPFSVIIEGEESPPPHKQKPNPMGSAFVHLTLPFISHPTEHHPKTPHGQTLLTMRHFCL